MGASDKAANAGNTLMGKVKVAVGKLTGKKSTVAGGRLDQAKASVRKTAETVKDRLKR